MPTITPDLAQLFTMALIYWLAFWIEGLLAFFFVAAIWWYFHVNAGVRAEDDDRQE